MCCFIEGENRNCKEKNGAIFGVTEWNGCSTCIQLALKWKIAVTLHLFLRVLTHPSLHH